MSFSMSQVRFSDSNRRLTMQETTKTDWNRIIRGSEWREAGGRGPRVGCRLKFHYFVGCRFNGFRPLSVVGKSQVIFLSLVGNFFPRFVGSR